MPVPNPLNNIEFPPNIGILVLVEFLDPELRNPEDVTVSGMGDPAQGYLGWPALVLQAQVLVVVGKVAVSLPEVVVPEVDGWLLAGLGLDWLGSTQSRQFCRLAWLPFVSVDMAVAVCFAPVLLYIG